MERGESISSFSFSGFGLTVAPRAPFGVKVGETNSEHREGSKHRARISQTFKNDEPYFSLHCFGTEIALRASFGVDRGGANVESHEESKNRTRNVRLCV